jgi:hypothetical protein
MGVLTQFPTHVKLCPKVSPGWNSFLLSPKGFVKKWNFADVTLYLMCMKHSWNQHWDWPNWTAALEALILPFSVKQSSPLTEYPSMFLACVQLACSVNLTESLTFYSPKITQPVVVQLRMQWRHDNLSNCIANRKMIKWKDHRYRLC